MSKYLFLLYADETQGPKPGSPELEQQIAAYDRYYHEVADRGLFQGGDPVQPSATATTVRVRDGAMQAAAGPFAPGGDQVIGFYVLDCKDHDEAVTYAARIPAASHGAIEVRPILQM
jgi:hypothetical protein